MRAEIVIPTTHERAEYVIANVEKRFAHDFGGYSRYEGYGGWIPDDRISPIEEDHVRLVVSDISDRETVRQSAEYVKDELDEDSVFVEFITSDVEFI